MACRLYRISGRVQGVFFRDSTRREARRLGIHGYARNLSDGTVEVLACGDDDAVAELVQWLWHGPPMARVRQVDDLGVADPPAMPDFLIG